MLTAKRVNTYTPIAKTALKKLERREHRLVHSRKKSQCMQHAFTFKLISSDKAPLRKSGDFSKLVYTKPVL